MDKFVINPSKLHGNLVIPSSKSHTLRAIVFAFLAKGTSQIHKFLPSPDTDAMLQAIQAMGACVKIVDETLYITGVNGKPQPAEDVIQCGNSGLVLRLIGAIAALSPSYTVLTGDFSIRHHRPVKPLLSALSQLGAFAASCRGDDHAPILIKGPFTKNYASLCAQDSQPVSGLLIASAFGEHPITIEALNPKETPWIDLTLDWLKRLNIPCKASNYLRYEIEGNSRIDAFSYTVPGDFSTAAFPLVGALLTGSHLTLHNLDMQDIQGDKVIFSIVQKMGAKLTIHESARKIEIHPTSALQGIRIDMNECVDALPILAVLGCFAKGKTELVNCLIARYKESDRISAISQELKKMGAILEESDDKLVIYPSSLKGANLDSHLDHRIALSLIIGAMAAEEKSTLHRTACIAKTYPKFVEHFQSIGACIETSDPLRV